MSAKAPGSAYLPLPMEGPRAALGLPRHLKAPGGFRRSAEPKAWARHSQEFLPTPVLAVHPPTPGRDGTQGMLGQSPPPLSACWCSEHGPGWQQGMEEAEGDRE